MQSPAIRLHLCESIFFYNQFALSVIRAVASNRPTEALASVIFVHGHCLSHEFFLATALLTMESRLLRNVGFAVLCFKNIDFPENATKMLE